MSQSSSDADRIERDLNTTRSRLGSHLSELQDRLSPGQMIDDAMSYFRGSDGADFGRNLLESVRANPLPAALTGIGLAWLMATGSRPGAVSQTSSGTLPASGGTSRVRVYGVGETASQGGYADMEARVRLAEQSVVRSQDEAEPTYTSRLDDARGQAMGLKRQAEETAQSYGQRISDALASAKQGIIEGAHDLRDQVGDAASSLGGTAQGAMRSIGGASQRMGGAVGQTGGNLMSGLMESPVLLGALGLAAGALLGALLPQSDQEEAALGGIAGQARDTARDLAQQAMDRGGSVAQTVLAKGRESAEAQGLMGGKSAGSLVDAALSGELAGSAKQVVQDVLRVGDEGVRKDVLGKGGSPASAS